MALRLAKTCRPAPAEAGRIQCFRALPLTALHLKDVPALTSGVRTAHRYDCAELWKLHGVEREFLLSNPSGAGWGCDVCEANVVKTNPAILG